MRTPAQFNVPFFHSYCVKTYVGHREWVRTVKVSPDGRLLADEYIAEHGVYVIVSCLVLTGALLASCSNDQVSCVIVASVQVLLL